MNRTGNRKRHDAILHDLAAFAHDRGLTHETEFIVQRGEGQAGRGRRSADLLVSAAGQGFVIEVKRELVWPHQLDRARAQVQEYRHLLLRRYPGASYRQAVIVCPSIHPRVGTNGTPPVLTPHAFKALIDELLAAGAEAVA